jgi:putative endonuclease
MAACVYILYSTTLDRYYVGSTTLSAEERLEKHLARHRHFTSKAKDWQIVYREHYGSKSEACQRERQIKRWKSRKRIKALFSTE